MSSERPIVFKVASEEAEFEQVFRLNYRTFVEEIPQHTPNPERRLADRFHAENTYLIALARERLVGMLAVREQRPFSLDEKLGNLDQYLRPCQKPCEVRLLAVAPAYRTGRVFQGLLVLLLDHARNRRLDLALISGTVRQLNLYRRLGFVPFGPLVGPPEARYQPMCLNLLGPCLEGLDLQRLRPMGTGVLLLGPGWKVQVLADPGRDYALYLTPERPAPGKTGADLAGENGTPRTPARLEVDLPAGTYRVEWRDPLTGHDLSREHRAHSGGPLLLRAPASTEPLSARLRRLWPL